MTNTRILIVEDDPALRFLLRDNLAYEGYSVECAADSASALARARQSPPDLMLLDLMLPDGDGLDVCRAVCRNCPHTSIIILTSKREPIDKIRGLDLGADDYVTKPCGIGELLARVRAVLRRTRPSVEELALDTVRIDFMARTATRDGQPLLLTAREFELLQYLSERHGAVVTRQELLKMVWGYEASALTRTVDIFIARLRRKVELDPKHPKHILTSHGDGYLLVT
ncbi:MAG: response regulator transcription factor [Vicinamibacterales bacterium]